MKTNYLLTICLLINFLFISAFLSCSPNLKESPTVKITTATNSISSAAQNIKTENKTISTTAQSIQKTTQEPATKVKASEIVQSTLVIDRASQSLTESSSIITKAQIELEKNCSTLKAENEKLKQEKSSAINKLLDSLIVGSILCLAGSIAVMIWINNKVGAIGGVASALVLILAIFVKSYLVYILVAGGLIFAAILFYLIYSAFKHKTTSQTTSTAVNELVQLIEELKGYLPEDIRTKFFGLPTPPPPPVPTASQVQSESTQSLVAQIRGKVVS